MLIDNKADLNLCNKLHWDWTPLHQAVLQDDPDLIKVLLKAGADPKKRDSVGRDALQLADEHYKENAKKVLRK